MTDDVNERIVARVRHCKPMSAKPQDVDVFVPKSVYLGQLVSEYTSHVKFLDADIGKLMIRI